MLHCRQIGGETDSETERQTLIRLQRTGVETLTCNSPSQKNKPRKAEIKLRIQIY